MSLTLSIAGISVTLDRFLDGEYPRVVVNSTPAEYSALGSPNVSGPAYVGKHIWTFTAIVTQEQRDLIEAIAFESNERRRLLLDYDILIYDRTATYKERNPRTRALCPGASVQSVGGSHIAYYAVFNGIFTENPKFSKLGESVYDSVSLSLVETVVVGI